MREIIFAALMAGASFTGMATAAVPAASPVTATTITASSYDKAPWWMKDSVITQTGMVYAEVPANRASFNATFLRVDDSSDKAQAKAIDQTRALNQALAKLGKDAVRVTTSFSMRALYEQYRDKDGNKIENQRGDKINGYQVSLNLSLEVRDMSVLEKAYALVLAATPTTTGTIYFSLQPTNAQNTWMYTEAVKDARVRATQAAEAAGGKLGGIKVIDPTGRACQTDILARGGADYGDSGESAQMVSPPVVQARMTADADVAAPPPIPVPPVPGSAEFIEAKALANPFIQTPPLQRLDAMACVVYGLN